MPNPAYFALMIPIIIFMIPIIAILTHHQRKMAEIVHSRAQSQGNGELELIRREMQALRDLVNQQAIAIDNLVALQTKLSAPPVDLQERVSR